MIMGSDTSFPIDTILKKDIPIPLYYQLKEILLDFIHKAKSGEAIPTEKQLCAQFDISRQTVRQAINELTADGYLRRLKGKGTFITKSKITQDHLSFVDSFQESMERKGLIVKTKVLESIIVQSDRHIEEALSLAPKSDVVKLRRLRYVNGETNNIALNYLPRAKFPGILKKDLECESLYKIIREDYGYKIDRCAGTIESTIAGEYEAEILDISVGTPILYVENITFLQDGTPIEFFMVNYRGDINKHSYQIKKK